MTPITRRRALAAAGGTTLMLLTACGGNLDTGSGGSGSGDDYPSGPITVLVGTSAGGSTDLIARALADKASEELGVAITVENRTGANGALAAQELAGAAPDGQTLMLFNGSLAYITPLAVGADEAVDINDYTVVTGISQDDYVLVSKGGSDLTTVADIAAEGQVSYGTTGIGTGSQLSTALLLGEIGASGTAVPFDGGSPTLTAVLGGQVDIASIQLGEAVSAIQSGDLTPIVTFAAERPEFLPDTPTAAEAGAPQAVVQQSRALAGPKGMSAEVVSALESAYEAAFAEESYKTFNTERMLTPNEVPGSELSEQWTTNLENYRSLAEEYGIELGGGQ